MADFDVEELLNTKDSKFNAALLFLFQIQDVIRDAYRFNQHGNHVSRHKALDTIYNRCYAKYQRIRKKKADSEKLDEARKSAEVARTNYFKKINALNSAERKIKLNNIPRKYVPQVAFGKELFDYEVALDNYERECITALDACGWLVPDNKGALDAVMG
jgi:hypothetical protein